MDPRVGRVPRHGTVRYMTRYDMIWYDYDMTWYTSTVNVQSKNWRTAIYTGSETKRNNGKNIKQADESDKQY